MNFLQEYLLSLITFIVGIQLQYMLTLVQFFLLKLPNRIDMLVGLPYLFSYLNPQLSNINLVYVIRFFDFIDIFNKIEDKIIKNNHIGDALKCILIIFFVAHLSACTIHYISLLPLSKNEKTYLDSVDVDIRQWFQVYTYSFYWSMITMTTIGYGDIHPNSHRERIYATFFALLSCLVFGFTLNQIGQIISNNYMNSAQIRRKQAIIDEYMKQRNVSPDLQIQVKKNIEYNYNEKGQQDKLVDDIINSLTTSLKKELKVELYKKLLKGVQSFHFNFSDQFLYELSMSFKELTFNQEHQIYTENEDSNRLYYIIRGEVELYYQLNKCPILVKILEYDEINILLIKQKNEILGLEEFFSQQCRQMSAKASRLTTVAFIDYDNFIEVLKKHQPDQETYRMIFDSINLNGYTSRIQIKCYNCNSLSHKFQECPYIFFQKDERLFRENRLLKKGFIKCFETHEERQPYERKRKQKVKVQKKMIRLWESLFRFLIINIEILQTYYTDQVNIYNQQNQDLDENETDEDNENQDDQAQGDDEIDEKKVDHIQTNQTTEDDNQNTHLDYIQMLMSKDQKFVEEIQNGKRKIDSRSSFAQQFFAGNNRSSSKIEIDLQQNQAITIDASDNNSSNYPIFPANIPLNQQNPSQKSQNSIFTLMNINHFPNENQQFQNLQNDQKSIQTNFQSPQFFPYNQPSVQGKLFDKKKEEHQNQQVRFSLFNHQEQTGEIEQSTQSVVGEHQFPQSQNNYILMIGDQNYQTPGSSVIDNTKQNVLVNNEFVYTSGQDNNSQISQLESLLPIKSKSKTENQSHLMILNKDQNNNVSELQFDIQSDQNLTHRKQFMFNFDSKNQQQILDAQNQLNSPNSQNIINQQFTYHQQKSNSPQNNLQDNYSNIQIKKPAKVQLFQETPLNNSVSIQLEDQKDQQQKYQTYQVEDNRDNSNNNQQVQILKGSNKKTTLKIEFGQQVIPQLNSDFDNVGVSNYQISTYNSNFLQNTNNPTQGTIGTNVKSQDENYTTSNSRIVPTIHQNSFGQIPLLGGRSISVKKNTYFGIFDEQMQSIKNIADKEKVLAILKKQQKNSNSQKEIEQGSSSIRKGKRKQTREKSIINPKQIENLSQSQDMPNVPQPPKLKKHQSSRTRSPQKIPLESTFAAKQMDLHNQALNKNKQALDNLNSTYQQNYQAKMQNSPKSSQFQQNIFNLKNVKYQQDQQMTQRKKTLKKVSLKLPDSSVNSPSRANSKNQEGTFTKITLNTNSQNPSITLIPNEIRDEDIETEDESTELFSLLPEFETMKVYKVYFPWNNYTRVIKNILNPKKKRQKDLLTLLTKQRTRCNISNQLNEKVKVTPFTNL